MGLLLNPLESGHMAFIGAVGFDHIAVCDLFQLHALVHLHFCLFAVCILDSIVFAINVHKNALDGILGNPLPRLGVTSWSFMDQPQMQVLHRPEVRPSAFQDFS